MSRLVLKFAVAIGAACALLWSDSALAERRVALVIGNSFYQNAPPLPNPSRDAKAIAANLKKAGFEVVAAHNDLGNLQFKRAIRQFEDLAAEADITVVFYAGHGIEIRGVNYMIPVDAKLASDRDADDEAITLDRLLETIEGTKKLSLVILDACRDNPFVRSMKRQRTAATRAVSAGLALVGPTSRNTLIAYAAKSGTAAEDGNTEHSPFTHALLNHLFEPGLDIRLAFGRVRDEVLKLTGNRQEPFVSGSLGGSNIALVAAPAQAAPKVADGAGEKADYNLVEKIGTQGAWEIFLTQYPKGFYSDLARQQLQKLQMPMVPQAAPATATRAAPEGPAVATLTPPKPPVAKGPTSEEQRAWDKIKDSSNISAFRDFIKRYPSSVLANTAQARLEALERAAQEREEKARAEREAKAAEAARQKAEDERARQEAERARQEAAAEAARKQAEAAAEAARQKAIRDAEAARLKVERDAEVARQKAEREAEAASQKAERDAAAKRAEEERLAKLSEAARAKAEREAAAKRAEEERKEALRRAEEERRARAAEAAERQKAEREAAAQRAEEERKAKAAEAAERQKAEREAAAQRAEEERQARLAAAARAKQAKQDDNCKREKELLDALAAVGDQGWARADLHRLERGLTCERLRPEVIAALDMTTHTPELKVPPAAIEAAKPVNTPELVRTAQHELARIGCFAGTASGELNDVTKGAIKRYRSERGQPTGKMDKIEVTEALVSELKDRSKRVCPLVCSAGQIAEGERCVAVKKPTPVARQKDEDEERPRRPQRARQQVEEEDRPRRPQRARQQESRPAPAARPQPRVRQEAASPRYSGGGGGGGGGGGRAMIGVGF